MTLKYDKYTSVRPIPYQILTISLPTLYNYEDD